MRRTVTAAKMSDLEDIKLLISDCVADMISLGNDQWDKEYPGEQELLTDILKKELFVLKADGLYAAVVTMNADQEQEYNSVEWTGSNFMIVHRLAVNPALKGAGIGRSLMSYVEDLARQHGKDSIRLDTYSKNIAAVEFYKKLGYRILGEVHFDRRPLPYPAFEKML